MSSCTIEIDNNQDEYHPGNTVEGRVVCTFYKPKTIKEVRIELRADERTFWTIQVPQIDQRTMMQCTRSEEYKGYNKILSVEKCLTGEGELEPGRYEYPFTFDLSDRIPGTYTGEHGWIKYFLKATVDRKYQVNYEHETQFVVVAPIDLNLLQKQLVLEPVEYSSEKTVFSPFCCSNGPVVMDVHFPKKAFIQEESFTIKVEISNMSRESIQFVRLTLETELEVMVTTPVVEVKTYHQTLLTGEESGVDANSERTYKFNLKIPKSAVIPNFSLCKLLKYKSWINVIAAKPYVVTLDVHTPIVIGQIPVRDKGDIETMKTVQHSAHSILPNQLSQGDQLTVSGKPVIPSSIPPVARPSAPPLEDKPPEIAPPSYDSIYKD